MTLTAESPAETRARVTTGVSDVNEVSIHHEDEEWTCDCESRADPCTHVCALTAHAIDQTEKGITLAVVIEKENRRPSHVAYRFTVAPLSGGVTELHFERVIRSPSGEKTLRLDPKVAVVPGFIGALDAFVRTSSTRVNVTEDDRAVDKVLGREMRARLPHEKLRALLKKLSSSDRVELDGKKISVAAEPISPTLKILDNALGVTLRMEAPPGIARVLAPCVALKGGEIVLFEGTDLGGDRFERLPVEQTIPTRELGDFVSGPLRDLERRFVVRVESDKLPGRVRKLAPRVQFDVALEGTSLRVRPFIVYGDPPIARVDGGRLVAIDKSICPRDEAGERVLEDELRHELHLRMNADVTFDGKDAARMLEALARHGAKTDAAAGNDAAGNDKDDRAAVARGSIVPGAMRALIPKVVTAGDDVRMEFSVGNEKVDPRAVMEAWEHGHAIVPIAGLGFAELPREFLQKHAARVRVLLDARDERGRLRAYAAREVDDLCRAAGASLPMRIQEMARGLEEDGARGHTPLPADLTTELRPYQREGVDWLGFLQRTKQGGLLADDMGLGKTIQALCVLGPGSLVVCPTSVMHNWATEIAKFRPALKHAMYHGPKRNLDPDVDITITSYALLRLDAPTLTAKQWSTVVLDEAQNIKNADSQAARTARALKADFRLALTGTPVENHLEELWSELDFACPGLLGTRSDFRSRYAEPVAAGETRALEGLRKRTRPFLLRRTKEQVASDLPPRTDEILYCELDDDERAIYDTVLAATRHEIVLDLDRGKNPLAILEALLRLRQAACHVSLVPGFSRERSSKVDRLSAALVELADEGHRALVFSQWTSFLDLVETELDATKVSYCRLDGSTKDRGGVVQQFQDPKGPTVMLVSLKAGGSGLNLTAADHVFLLDPWWNPAVEEQAADRAHRIGQEKPVFVYRLVTKDTVEEGMLLLADRKRRLAEAALEGAGAAAAITREDLLALLS